MVAGHGNYQLGAQEVEEVGILQLEFASALHQSLQQDLQKGFLQSQYSEEQGVVVIRLPLPLPLRTAVEVRLEGVRGAVRHGLLVR